VLIPVKGQAEDQAALAAFLAACTCQTGVSYRLVFAVESASDPAAALVTALADPRIAWVVAGRTTLRGQKVHNLLAALGTLTSADRIVVFADADALWPADWLAQLVRPIVLGRAGVASGYRWILPQDDHPASRLAALMDWSVATCARARRWNLCWGGATALSREALDRIDLPTIWAGALLDDLTLTRAARRAGIVIHAPLFALVPSPVRHDWRSLFAFGRRQYLLVRVHAPRHWWLALITFAVPVAGFATALQAGAWGWICIGLAALLQQLRAALRLRIARRVLPPAASAQTARILRRWRWLLPGAQILHLLLIVSSAFGRTMVWAGRRYRLLSPERVIVDLNP
jgi:cellulose synthase/poly-beta-1,6-N-acetylglucosamine synthase-like glycosyltransferase